MYEANYLASRLRAASIGADETPFLRNHQTGETQSYGTFFANAERMAAVLLAAGIKPGDRVAVQAPKTVAMLELYVGTVMAGAVFLPLNTAYTSPELRYFLGDAAPRVLICDPVDYNALAPLAKECGVATILTLAADETGTLINQKMTQKTGFSPVPRGPDDLAAILYTSGTTGRSKGAMLTHKALASNAEALQEAWKFTREDVLIHALPIFHTHGLFVATNITLMSGSSCIFMAGFDANVIRDYMHEASVLMGVPTFYTRLLETPELADAAHDMRLFISGSAPLLAETHERWSALTGHDILERYGMTETNMNTSNPYIGERRPGTVGMPLPGVELKICDPSSGEELKKGDIGVIEVKGDNVFAGYWKMPEKTAEELREDGFFITGDLGLIDGDGYVHIVGRGKDLIITGGFNVYPKEVEGVIDDLPGIMESAIIGVPHPDFGEAVVAVIVAEKGSDVTAQMVKDGVAGQLAKFKQPKKIQVVAELPRNTMGKVQKNVLRETFKALFDQRPA